MTAQNFIGASGWSYGAWKDAFYPHGIGSSDWLHYYASQFNTVEINATFYRLPTPMAVAKWYDATPDDFIFSVKLSRYITHLKRLKLDEETQQALQNFFDILSGLRHKLGVILIQLPASVQADLGRLETCITAMQATLARHTIDPRIAVEFRHGSWFVPEVLDYLRRCNIASVWNSGPSAMPANTPVTADFLYVRFHGVRQLYASSYSKAEMKEWAVRISSAPTATVFAYFNNTMHMHALANAWELREVLSGQ